MILKFNQIAKIVKNRLILFYIYIKFLFILLLINLKNFLNARGIYQLKKTNSTFIFSFETSFQLHRYR